MEPKQEAVHNILNEVAVEMIPSEDERNVFIEYSNNFLPSGLAMNERDFYFITMKDIYVIATTEKIKTLCRKYIGTNKDVSYNNKKGINLPIQDLFTK